MTPFKGKLLRISFNNGLFPILKNFCSEQRKSLRLNPTFQPFIRGGVEMKEKGPGRQFQLNQKKQIM